MPRSSRRTPEPPAAGDDFPGALLACTDYVLSTLSLSIAHHFDAELAPVGLRLRTYRLLRLLHDDGPQRQSVIGAALGLDRTTIVALIDEVEAAGFARRERAPDDRRHYLVQLTPAGRRTIRRAVERTSNAEASMFAPLSVAERAALHDLAKRLLTAPGAIADAHRREYEALVERRR